MRATLNYMERETAQVPAKPRRLTAGRARMALALGYLTAVNEPVIEARPLLPVQSDLAAIRKGFDALQYQLEIIYDLLKRQDIPETKWHALRRKASEIREVQEKLRALLV